MTARILGAVALLALWAEAALATSIRFVPVPERVAQADVVAVGTVTGVDDKLIEAEPHPGAPKVRYRVAVVKVTEKFLGPGDETHLRVAFVPKEDQPKDGLRIPTPVLEKGNEVILFLRKRSDEGFYRINGHFGAVGKEATNPYLRDDFEKVLKEAKPACKIVSDGAKALKSKDEGERMTAAWLLVLRYRRQPADVPYGKAAEEEIGAEESEAIVEGLLLLAKKNRDAFYQAAYSLNLAKEEGFGQQFTPEKAAEWLKEHAKTYRVKKLVAPTKK